MNGDDHQEPGVLRLDEPTSRDAPVGLTRFETLFAQFYPEMFGLVFRILGDHMETEDVLQETFLKLADQAELQVRPEAEIAAWLRRVGMNHAFNRLRSARRARGRLERVGRLEHAESDSDAYDPDDAPPTSFERDEERAVVRRALADLPERQRECLLLRHSGYAYTEIAATLGIAVGSVGVLLARAEQAFRTNYRRLDGNV